MFTDSFFTLENSSNAVSRERTYRTHQVDINNTLSGTPPGHRKRFYAKIGAVAAEESKVY
jgi:hypothetical protein